MPITGTEFESLVKPFFGKLFKDMGYLTLEIRNQQSGTQNGFDIKIIFEDNSNKERSLFIECKYYKSSKLEWSEIFNKQVELKASNYRPSGFILLSPLQILSNINDSAQTEFEKLVRFPIEFWTPDKKIDKLFALDKVLYERVFDRKCELDIDKKEQIQCTKARIELILQKCEIYRFANIIEIKDADRLPNENDGLVTTLDKKLNSILEENDEERINYHQYRVNYKVYLEELEDVNNDLRQKILKWQDNMRIRAKRLTQKFNISGSYNSQQFFHDFFDDAEKQLLVFYKENEIKEDCEKLLNGIVFELAAECPLDWRKKNS